MAVEALQRQSRGSEIWFKNKQNQGKIQRKKLMIREKIYRVEKNLARLWRQNILSEIWSEWKKKISKLKFCVWETLCGFFQLLFLFLTEILDFISVGSLNRKGIAFFEILQNAISFSGLCFFDTAHWARDMYCTRPRATLSQAVGP